MNGLTALLAQASGAPTGLTFAGGLIMTVSVALVLGLAAFCMSRILREEKPAGHHHAPLDIDTPDTER